MQQMQLKDRLKMARKQAGLTQKDVERKIKGMVQSTYSELERGNSKSTSRIVELANLFKVDPNWLATGKQGTLRPSNKVQDNNVGKQIAIPFDNLDAEPLLEDKIVIVDLSDTLLSSAKIYAVYIDGQCYLRQNQVR